MQKELCIQCGMVVDTRFTATVALCILLTSTSNNPTTASSAIQVCIRFLLPIYVSILMLAS